MFIVLDDKLHMYCNFGHNLFKPCVSASPIFLARFDTIIRFFISGSNVEGSMQHLTAWRTQSGWWMGLSGGGWWVGWGGVASGGPLVFGQYDQEGHNVDAKLLILSSPLVHFGIHIMRPLNIWGPIWHSFSFGLLIFFDRPYHGVQYIRNLRWHKFWNFLLPDWTFACWFIL